MLAPSAHVLSLLSTLSDFFCGSQILRLGKTRGAPRCFDVPIPQQPHPYAQARTDALTGSQSTHPKACDLFLSFCICFIGQHVGDRHGPMCIMHSSAHVCNGEYHFTGMADDNDASCIPSSFISLFWFDGSPACIAGRANHLSLSHTHTCSFTCSFRHLINSSPPNVSANIATSAEARVFSAILPEPCHLQYPSSHISVTMHFHIFPEHYKSDCPVELTVTEKALSLSGESYNITNADGEIVFKMDGHALSIRDKCVLENHHGHGILVARKKLRTMHERWEVCKGDDFDDDKLLFSVKKSSVIDFKTHLLVFLKENESEECPDFEVKGNFFDREVQIFHGDQVIAEVKRKYSVGNVLLDKHTFCVVVHPNVDQAFVVALVIIMDRIHED